MYMVLDEIKHVKGLKAKDVVDLVMKNQGKVSLYGLDDEIIKQLVIGYMKIRKMTPKMVNITSYMGRGDEYASKAYPIAYQLHKLIVNMISEALEGNLRAVELAYSLALYINNAGMNFVYDYIDFVLNNTEYIRFDMTFVAEWFIRYINS